MEADEVDEQAPSIASAHNEEPPAQPTDPAEAGGDAKEGPQPDSIVVEHAAQERGPTIVAVDDPDRSPPAAHDEEVPVVVISDAAKVWFLRLLMSFCCNRHEPHAAAIFPCTRTPPHALCYDASAPCRLPALSPNQPATCHG